MNGRIYDGLLGRFLSADLTVEAPGDLQAYNRYSYVRNRPLTLTDPTGFVTDAVDHMQNYWDSHPEEAAAHQEQMVALRSESSGPMGAINGGLDAVEGLVVLPVRAVLDNDRLTTELADRWTGDSAAAEGVGLPGWVGGVNRYNPLAMLASGITGTDRITREPIGIRERAANVTGAAIFLLPFKGLFKSKAAAPVEAAEATTRQATAAADRAGGRIASTEKVAAPETPPPSEAGTTATQSEATARPKLSKVKKSETVETIGGKFIKTSEVRPGYDPGQTHAVIVRIKNLAGRVIRTYKDSFDRANRFQHRKPLRGGPEGRPQQDGS